MDLRKILLGIEAFESDVHQLFAKYETSNARVLDLSKTYSELKGLSLKQDDLFRQALRCVEHELFRAAHVMAWAAFMDFLEEKLQAKGLRRIHSEYPNWSKFKSFEALKENVPEFQLVECAERLGLCTKTQSRALKGLLNKRNECAHPSEYYPELNESLGYISELFKRISQIAGK